ncbi:response regulator transcription factor [Adlercreutzia murintestinalis]|uniref:response regulator transcription factor n=1 Tax=Adlercreutzia murintestinalis TaxID=2941325 RepID=UPI0020409AAF|nr:response regulator transcription factor [Adlercreutzia murintestinalis]
MAANTDKTRVMVVDDEQEIADLVASLLQPEGMETAVFTDPEEALAAFAQDPFDMAIIDVMMPKMDGFELCGRMRALSDVPIVFLSARDEETDQVVGFTMGADDYVTKPFKPRELVARVRAHLRRARRGATPASPGQLEAHGIAVDLLAHEASLHDKPLSLTPKEFAILALLMQNAGQPVPASEIYERVWDERYDASASNTVMVHIRHVREKLAAIDSSKELIETVWGVGYRIAAEGAGSLPEQSA